MTFYLVPGDMETDVEELSARAFSGKKIWQGSIGIDGHPQGDIFMMFVSLFYGSLREIARGGGGRPSLATLLQPGRKQRGWLPFGVCLGMESAVVGRERNANLDMRSVSSCGKDVSPDGP